MKRLLPIWAACLLTAGTAAAQQTLSNSQMIGITPLLSSHLELPGDARNALNNKLNQIVTQNGFGAMTGQFILTCNVVNTDKQVSATAPPQFIVKQQVSFYVLDAADGVVLDELAIDVQGIDRLEPKAVIQGINQISPQSTKIKAFMRNVREKIVQYYTTRIPTLITKAQALADRQEYAQALQVLKVIPEATAEYPAVADQMSAIHKLLVERESAKALRNAQGRVAAKDFYGAVDELQFVDPESEAYAQVPALLTQIEQVAGKHFEVQHAEAMRELEAFEAVSVEQAKADAQKQVDSWYLVVF